MKKHILDFNSFNENVSHSDTLAPIETFQVNRERQRNVYKIDDISIYVDDVVPSNFMRKSYSIAIIDYNIPITENNKKMIEDSNGFINENGYFEDGYGNIGFDSRNGNVDVLDSAIKFIEQIPLLEANK